MLFLRFWIFILLCQNLDCLKDSDYLQPWFLAFFMWVSKMLNWTSYYRWNSLIHFSLICKGQNILCFDWALLRLIERKASVDLLFRSGLCLKDRHRKELVSGTFFYWSSKTAKNLQRICSQAFPHNCLGSIHIRRKGLDSTVFFFYGC